MLNKDFIKTDAKLKYKITIQLSTIVTDVLPLSIMHNFFINDFEKSVHCFFFSTALVSQLICENVGRLQIAFTYFITAKIKLLYSNVACAGLPDFGKTTIELFDLQSATNGQQALFSESSSVTMSNLPSCRVVESISTYLAEN